MTKSRRILLAALGVLVVLGAVWFFFGRDDDEADRNALLIQGDDVCWTVTLPALPEQPERGEQQGCGTTEMDVPTVEGDRTVVVTRTSGEGSLSVFVIKEGKRGDPQPVDPNGSVTLAL